MSKSETDDSLQGIAIVGIAGRFPRASTIDVFWQNLQDGLECVSFFSDEEVEASGVEPTLINDPYYVKAAAILEDAEWFDASFFGFTPREAEIMDPQHRLVLECAWQALESAGYDPEKYKGSIGVYAGASMNTYLSSNLYSNPDILKLMGDYHIMLGNDKDFMPTRVSYKLNLKGPSVNVQTACSTSLVAVCQAYQSLLNYQCDMALAGGVSLRFPQKAGYLFQEGGIRSPDGHCRAFDNEAKGTVGGEGVGIVVLKRLEDALAEGDSIYSVIKGAAINNDGSLKVAYTAPSVAGQAEVISMAQALAGIDAETITYVEAHGTGTALGDPIEIAGLTKAFSASTGSKGFCAIGSVKTNIGHLDAAAGIAGLIKTSLALQNKLLPPSLHLKQPNSKIDFAKSPFYVNAELSEWRAEDTPRRAGVSSFGIGGTNAHVVLEEAPFIKTCEASRPWHLLMLSAKSSSALDVATNNLVEHLTNNADLKLADVAYTLQVGRRAFDYRRILVCSDIRDAKKGLQARDPKRVFTSFKASRNPSTVFMFSGQGAQYVNMGLELYQVEPTFREQIDLCADLLKSHLGLDLRRLLYPLEDEAEKAGKQLNQTAIAQPALFAIEYATAKLWQSWGVQPQAMIGHSVGELTAASLAGVFSLEDALAVVATRGRLIQSLPGGAMLAVRLPEEEISPLLNEKLSLAGINGPSLSVVSGPEDAVDQMEKQLGKNSVVCSRLHTSHAFHSAMMDSILAPLTEYIKKVSLNPPRIPYVSCVTGTWITASEATDPGYWAKHCRQPVRFVQGLAELLKQPERILLEVGPGHTLSTLAKQHPDKTDGQFILSSLRHLHDRQSDLQFLLATLGRLWFAGLQVDWPGVYAHEQRRRIFLPTYPFERQRYWIEPTIQACTDRARPVSLYKKPDIEDWFYIPSWKRSAPPKHCEERVLASQKMSWLVFTDKYGLGLKMLEGLQQDGHDVISVIIGEQFCRRSETVYSINPQVGDDYDALFKELRALDKLPSRIVHLWSVSPNDPTSSGVEFLEASQYLGFYSVFFLAKALGKQDIEESLQIEIVSNDMQNVTGEEILCPEKATVLGPCRVIPHEYPNVTCRSIDIVLPKPNGEDEEKLIEQLLGELGTDPSDWIVGYRGQDRWVQTTEATRLNRTVNGTSVLRKGGVYLITGGLGGIGLVLAEYLAQTVQAKLVLTGRSILPKKDKWEQWLATHNNQDRISRKIRKVQVLEELGAEVLVVSADVASVEQMREVITRAHRRFSGIHGVIHAAGIADGSMSSGMIELRTSKMAGEVFSPKVRGTLVLETVLADEKLDLFVLCSSIASILPAVGQVDYSGANAFLDAFAHRYKARNSTVFVSINWDIWQEVGMAVDAEVPLHLKQWKEENLIKHGILPKEGQDAFNRILASPLPQVVVSKQDVNALVKRSDDFNALAFPERGEPESLSDSIDSKQVELSLQHARPSLSNVYLPARNEVERRIADIWEKLLGIKQVGIHDNFFELGGESLLATQVISRLRKTFQIELPLRTFFETPTVAGTAEALVEQEAVPGRTEAIARIRRSIDGMTTDEVQAMIRGDAP